MHNFSCFCLFFFLFFCWNSVINTKSDIWNVWLHFSRIVQLKSNVFLCFPSRFSIFFLPLFQKCLDVGIFKIWIGSSVSDGFLTHNYCLFFRNYQICLPLFMLFFIHNLCILLNKNLIHLLYKFGVPFQHCWFSFTFFDIISEWVLNKCTKVSLKENPIFKQYHT